MGARRPRGSVRALGILGLGLLLACPEPEEAPVPTEADRVLEAWESFLDASVSEDFGRVWDRTAEEPRRWFDDLQGRLKEEGAGGRELAAFREYMENEAGLGLEELRSLGPREFFAALRKASVEERREEWERQVRMARRLEVEKVRVKGDRARVDFELDGEWALRVDFRREDGRWRFANGLDAALAARIQPLEFKSLARKVAAYLPRSPDLRDVVAVVECGPEEPDDDDVARVKEQLDGVDRSGRERPAVVLDVAGDVSFGGFLRYYDAVLAAGFDDVLFALSIRPSWWSLERREKVCGDASSEENSALTWPEGVIEQAALARVLGVSDWDRWRLELVLEQDR